MTRALRFIIENQPHHIVQRGHNRTKLFLDQEDYRTYYYLLKKFSKDKTVLIYAYCLMINHVHLLIEPKKRENLPFFMKRLNVSYAKYFNKKYQRTGSVFESRYFSSPVETEQYLWTVCRYIEKNPVRTDGVENPTDFKWSSARFHMDLRGDDLIQEPLWKLPHEKMAYRSFLMEKEDPDHINFINNATNRNEWIGRIPK